MKGEMQSSHLEKMMQKYKRYPEYELILPMFSIKKKNSKRLVSGDILLLGLDVLELYFADAGKICAKVKLESHNETAKISIVSVSNIAINEYNSKKYEELYCSFCSLQCRALEVGHKVEFTAVELKYVEVFTAGKKLADGKLVVVDDEIAIEIMEVKHNA